MFVWLWIAQATSSPAFAADDDPDIGSAAPRGEQNRKNKTKGKAKSKKTGKSPTNRNDSAAPPPKNAAAGKPLAVGPAHDGKQGPGGGEGPGPRPTEKPEQGPAHGPDARRPDSAEGRVAERTPRSTNRPATAPADTRASNPREVHTTAREHVAVHRHPVARVRVTHVPLYRGHDHRWARPHAFVVVHHPHHPHPHYVWYRPRWTHWWVHPYWRWTHATSVVIAFDYTPDPWDHAWAPPARAGWVWVPGHMQGGWWVPGHWEPVRAAAPTWYGTSWVWVPGWWMGPVWVEGYWRPVTRPGWLWADGYYLDDGEYVRGWWEPESAPPQPGYVWEGGHYDGETWVEGYWRPESREGYRWVSAWLDAESAIYYEGYWEPLEAKPGMVWVPGWFDGSQWVEGEWVTEAEYAESEAEAENWQPNEGWDQQPAEGQNVLPKDELPPALPYNGPPDGEG